MTDREAHAESQKGYQSSLDLKISSIMRCLTSLESKHENEKVKRNSQGKYADLLTKRINSLAEKIERDDQMHTNEIYQLEKKISELEDICLQRREVEPQVFHEKFRIVKRPRYEDKNKDDRNTLFQHSRTLSPSPPPPLPPRRYRSRTPEKIWYLESERRDTRLD